MAPKRPSKTPSYSEEEEEEEEIDETIDRNALDQDEDLDLDEYSEVEDEPKYLKKKPKRSVFIESEAIVGEEEEEDEEAYGRRRKGSKAEEEEEDFIEEDEEELLEAQQTYSRLLSERIHLPRMTDVDDHTLAREAELEAERIKSLYGRSGAAAARAAAAEQGFLPETFLAPTVQDPKLWMVRCRPGKERLVAFSLMRRYLTMEESGDAPKIFSVVVREPLLKGFIYVEAFTKQDVVSFCEKVANVWSSSISLVPLNEMPDVLRISDGLSKGTAGPPLQINQWVRIKRGKYANDLAQILAIEDDSADGGSIARLRLLPRLAVLGGEGYDGRPAARLFNPIEVAERAKASGLPGPSRSATLGYWMFGNEYFKDGYLEKEIRTSGIIPLSSPPSLDELEAFGIIGDETDMLGLDAPEIIEHGMSVLVIDGELRNRIGIVDEVIDGGETAIVHFGQSAAPLSIPTKSLRKNFSLGDSVKVLRGSAAGTSGMVTRIDGPKISIFSQQNMGEVEVLIRDVGPEESASRIEAALEGGSKAAQLGQLLAREELVLIHGKGPAMVIKADSSTSYTVLDSRSQTCEHVKASLLQRIKPSKFALDATGATLSIGDRVRILHGSTQGTYGRIISIYRSILWVVIDGSEQNIISVRSSMAALPLATGQSSRIVSSAPPSLRRLRGRTVQIREGPYKGLSGLVKEIDMGSSTIWVELHTNSKRVGVPIKAVVDIPETPSVSSPASVPTTPMHQAGFATPGGLERPGWRTPGAAGFRTPGGGQFELGSRTPAYFQHSGNQTPAFKGFGATNDRSTSGFRTPAGGAGWKTPSATDGWRTPSTGGGGFLGGGRSTPAINPAPSPWGGGSGMASPWLASGSASPWAINTTEFSSGLGTPASPWSMYRTPTGSEDSMAFDPSWAIHPIQVIASIGDTKKNATVISVSSGPSSTMVSIQYLQGSSESIVTQVPITQLKLARPAKKDHVVVLSGEHCNTTGILVGIDGAEAIVRVDAPVHSASGFIIVPSLHVGKLVN